MLVHMSWSLWWWRSTWQSSGSMEKETNSGRESGWSARFLRVAVSWRQKERERGQNVVKQRECVHIDIVPWVCVFRAVLHVSVVLLWLTNNVSHMLIKGLLYRTSYNRATETIQYGSKSLYHKRETVIYNTRQHWKFWKVMICLFPSSNNIMSCVRYQMKRWLKMLAWADFCGEQQSFSVEWSRVCSGLKWPGQQRPLCSWSSLYTRHK